VRLLPTLRMRVLDARRCNTRDSQHLKSLLRLHFHMHKKIAMSK